MLRDSSKILYFFRVLCCQKPFTDPVAAEYSRSPEDSGGRVSAGSKLRRLVSASRQRRRLHLHRRDLQRAEDGCHGLLDNHRQHSVITTNCFIFFKCRYLRFYLIIISFKISIYSSYTLDYLYKVRFNIPTSSH